MDGQSASAQYSHSVSSSVRLSASYGYQFSKYLSPGFGRNLNYTSHDLDGRRVMEPSVIEDEVFERQRFSRTIVHR